MKVFADISKGLPERRIFNCSQESASLVTKQEAAMKKMLTCFNIKDTRTMCENYV